MCWICRLIELPTERPRSGRYLKDLFAEVCHFIERNNLVAYPQSYLYCVEQLERTLYGWTFDLDLLCPDQEDVRFRSPIGWMRKGSVELDQHSQCMYMLGDTVPKDPHGLIPLHQTDPPKDEINLLFTLSRDRSIESLLMDITVRDNSDSISLGAVEARMTQLLQQPSRSQAGGWRRIGHYDITKAEVILDNNGIEEKLLLDKVLDLQNDQIQANTQTDGNIDETINTYPTKMISISRFTSKNTKGFYLCNDEVEYKELANAIVDLLPIDSPVITDVLLSHALINGNVELCDDIFEEYNFKYVFPTLAHLLTLQKLERAPIDIFIKYILQGGPFKRGYVKSASLYECTDDVLALRKEQYKEKEHENDPPPTTFFEEKERLELLDREDLSIQEIPAQSILWSDGRKEFAVHANLDNVRHNHPMRRIHERRKSLSLWKEHLLVLQWMETRKMRLQSEESQMPLVKNEFSLRLDVMIIEIEQTEAILQKELDEFTLPTKIIAEIQYIINVVLKGGECSEDRLLDRFGWLICFCILLWLFPLPSDDA